MKRFLGLCLLAGAGVGAGTARAQQPYAVSLIPDSLKKGAHAVIREDKESMVVTGPAKAIYTLHQVTTILDEQGKSYLGFAEYSNSFWRLEDADMYVYDANGTQTQHIRQKQMTTTGYEGAEELATDVTRTAYVVTAPSYPITVQIDFTRTYKGLERYPDIYLDNTETSFQGAEFTLTVPKALAPRYRAHNINLVPVVTDGDKDNRIYTWKMGPKGAAPEEPGAPSDYAPMLYLAPTQFEMGGLPGDESTWKQLGQWGYDLNKETIDLPETSIEFYKQLVGGAATDREKARIIYNYLQNNFRYVSIQLGIGGLRSFPATFTEKKKYGDCKALSTYMCAALNAVGVKSYTAWINAGDMAQPVDPAFPMDGFNHVILCIPQPSDSIWLECTNKHTDFGVLGAFTENRNALLLTENGGVLVRTPTSTVRENTSNCYTKVHLAEDGSGNASVTMRQHGEDKWNMLEAFYDETRDNQKRYLVEDMDWPQPDDFTITQGKADSSVLTTGVAMTFEKVPEFTAGSKMFLNPRLYHIWPYKLPSEEHRTHDFCFPSPFSVTDTTCYQLPEGYVVDQLPKGDAFANDYASYASSYWYDAAQKCVYSRGVLTLATRRIPARDYSLVKAFFDHVIKEETEKIVINKP